MIPRRHAIHAHVTRHAKALLGLTALTTPGGAGGDRTGRTVLSFGAVRSGLTTEVVPLHDARRPLAFAGSDDIDVRYAFEDRNVHDLAHLLVRRILEADLGEMTPRGVP